MNERRACRRVEYVDSVDDLGPGPVVVGEVLSGVLANLRRRVARDAGMLADRWRSVVGREHAEASRVISWKGGVLAVAVASPAQLQEFRMFRARQWVLDWSARFSDQPVDRIVFRLDGLRERHERAGS